MVNVTGPGWTPFNASVKTLGESNPAAAALADGRSLLAFRSHLKGGWVVFKWQVACVGVQHQTHLATHIRPNILIRVYIDILTIRE